VANVIRLRHRRQRRQSVYNIVGSTLMARTKEPKSEDGRAESGMVLWDRMFPLGGIFPSPPATGSGQRCTLCLFCRNIVPYKEIGIKESNHDVRTLTGSS